MQSLFDKWKSRIPNYREIYKDDLFIPLSNYGGGTAKTKYNLGRHFENGYELYMYAFFLGLYSDEFKPIDKDESKVNFRVPIQDWGKKTNRPGRVDFTELQEYIFAALVTKTDIDLIELEKGTLTDEEVVKNLLQIMEAYTNGGLMRISDKLEDSTMYFLQPPAFMNLIIDSKEEI